MTENIRGKMLFLACVVAIILGGVFLFLLYYLPSSDKESAKSSFADISLPENLAPEHVVLTVKGKIRRANPARFDLQTIQAFHPITFTTYDPWDKQERTYQGTSVIDILEFLEPNDSAEFIEVVARNDYTIDIYLKDLRRYPYIFSYTMDGKLYSEYAGSQNKGPLAIAIDFAGNPEIDMEIYKHQLVWFAETVTVK